MTGFPRMIIALTAGFALAMALSLALDTGARLQAQTGPGPYPHEERIPPVRDPAPAPPAPAETVPPGGVTIPDLNPTSGLTERGYTDIHPVDGAAAIEGEATYTALDPQGRPVEVVVDIHSGAILREAPLAER